MELPGFVGPSYTLRSVNAALQRSLNLYPEQNEMAPSKWNLAYTPGLRLIATLGTGPIRDEHKAANGRVFAVSGNKLYEITTPTAPVVVGTLTTSSGVVDIDDTFTSLVIVDGVHGYTLNFTTGVFAQITDTNFPVATSIAFLDNYILANDEDSGRFQFSALNDPTDWDGLDVATAEGSPDKLVALAVDHRELILFGDETTEVWFNSGDSLNPFQRRNGAFIQHGLAGKKLHGLLDNTRLWWSKDADGQAVAMRMNGYQAQRVSTYAVEIAVQSYGDISSGTCWAYQDGGHTFWVTSFPNAPVSWVFDVATGMWHERCYNNAGTEQRHRAECHVFHNNMHIVGDYQNGNIYELDLDTLSDNGVDIIKERVFPAVKVENKRVFYNSIEFDMEMGVGPTVALLDGNGVARSPQAMLAYADDGGHEFGNEKWFDLGQVGERGKRARLTRQGSARERIIKFRCTDAVPITMMAAWVDASTGAH
jgi:hypothetical protein